MIIFLLVMGVVLAIAGNHTPKLSLVKITAVSMQMIGVLILLAQVQGVFYGF